MCLAALGIFFLAGPTSSQGQTTPAPPAGLRVFYASHSLMWDMPPVLAQEVAAYGIKGHTIVGHQRIGVSRTSQHWNMADNQNEAKKALTAGNVDVFVTSNLVHPDTGIDNFVKLGLEHNPKMKFLMQISWPGLGYTDNEQFNAAGGAFGGAPGGGGGLPGFGGGGAIPGFGGGGRGCAPGGAPGAGGRGFAAAGAQGPVPGGGARGGAPGAGGARGGGLGGGGGMFLSGNDEKTPEELAKINLIDIKNAEEQARRLNTEAGKTVAYLVPTAQAHNALRTAIYKKEIPGMAAQSEVFIDPIGHPTAPVIALNAYLHFSVLYQRSPVGLPMPDVLKNANRPQWNDEKLNKKLQELAWDLVTKYPPSGVTAGGK
jgi:hypothetical protein